MSVTDYSIKLDEYDFLDFGCSKGGSIKFGMELFGGRGLGIDLNPEKVQQTREAGYNAVEFDASELDPSSMGTVRYAIMSHFLEHLPSILSARKCIEAAARISNEFVLIQQPYFDADGYLFDRELKLYWSDWRGHTLHMTTVQFYRICEGLLEAGQIARYLLLRRYPILHSNAKEIHALGSPRDQANWESALHPPKALLSFNYPVFRETCAVLLKDGELHDRNLEKYVRKSVVVYDSKRAFSA